jgi:hypothetical protein
MPTNWYSIDISGNHLGTFFSGYLNVDSSTNLVIDVVDPTYLDINILDPSNELHVPNDFHAFDFNKLIHDNNNDVHLSDGGLAIKTIPALDDTYSAKEWIIWHDSSTNHMTNHMSYKDSSGDWIDLVDGSSILINFEVHILLLAGPPANIHPLVTNICFPAGTPVLTDQGNIPIEKIDININTIRNKKITGVTKTLIKDKYLICFEKDSLGKNIPSQKTVISKNHKIMHKGVMMKAEEFIENNVNVHKIKNNEKPVYNVLMEEHNKMVVNNLICETLDPNNFIAKLYMFLRNKTPKEQQRITNLYNEYILDNNIFDETKKTSKISK